MRKINESDYASYTISGPGWSVTIHRLKDALREWSEMKFGTFYGNKHDGGRAIIDTK